MRAAFVVLAVVASTTAGSPAPAAPQGDLIAFDSNRRHQNGRDDFDIYVVRSDASGLRRVTSDARDDRFPTWSPDGRKIAFLRAHGTAICVVVLGNRGRRCFAAQAFADVRPAWAPRGNRIAFICAGPALCLLDPRTGQTRQLPKLTPAPTNGIGWAPDGRRIVYAAAGSLWIVDTQDAAVKRLTAENSDSYPAWSPDGTRIVFWSVRNGRFYRDPAAYGLFEVDPSIGEPSVRRLQLPAWYRPSWSPDGTRLALEGPGQILVADEQGATARPVTPRPGGGHGIAESPAWQP